MEICRQVYGDYSLLTSRLYINIGIVYEDNNDFVRAFEYFKKWGRVSEMVLGPEHPKTLRAKGVLKEPRYCLVAQRLMERERQLEESANDSQEGALTVEAINQEVERMANQEAGVAGEWDDNQRFGEGEEEEGEEELSEHYEGEGELVHVTEELQQAINDLLQRALGELEITDQLQDQAQGLIGLAERRINEHQQATNSPAAADTPATENSILSEHTQSQALDSNVLAEEATSSTDQSTRLSQGTPGGSSGEQQISVDSNGREENIQERAPIDSNIVAEELVSMVVNSSMAADDGSDSSSTDGRTQAEEVDSNIRAEEREQSETSHDLGRNQQTDNG